VTTSVGGIFFHASLVILRIVTKPPDPPPRWPRRVAAIALAAWLAPAGAQLGLPGALPALPGQAGRLVPLQPAPALASIVPLQDLRQRALRELLRNHADVLEADPAGEPVVRAELLLVAPDAASVDAAVALGFRVLREVTLDGLALRSVVLQPPDGVALAQALQRLRAIDARIDADFNHVYTRGGRTDDADVVVAQAPGAATRRVGLIDSGVERSHPALRAADLRPWGCGGVPVPSAHGSAVASLLVGRDASFAGVAPGATLFAADVYCGHASGGSVEAVGEALAWMARQGVGVINISLVGPANRLLERAVHALVQRGHLIVAAVGNDGPAAPPLYPASYPGVIGVTGVTPRRRVLPEAAQGPQVAFAAPGADLAVAQPGPGGYAVGRGTSFAAPLVAGLLSEALHEPDPAAALRALRALSGAATDLGAPGWDRVFGWGLVGEQMRVAPDRVQASARAAR
jgi:subtilisin family serine protease